ncbi:MAG: hypothetical protein A2Y15_04425 [Clostridiales bacterium GWF2_36_10]|nr:MAG: hypothetical protein A2Y15_04425 [Clostridiales bacterium GWF2_36_10]HAN20657.1 hypothetical protein [Clostridiales bacterium]
MEKEFEFDNAFSTFIDGNEYEATEDKLFKLVLAAFKAGWVAAGGDNTEEQKPIARCIGADYYLKKLNKIHQHQTNKL